MSAPGPSDPPTLAQRTSASLQQALDDALALSARRGAALDALQRECERVYAHLPAIERMTHSALERDAEHHRRLEDHERARARLAEQLAEQRDLHERVIARLEAEREHLRELAELQERERAAAADGLEQLREERAMRLRAERDAGDLRAELAALRRACEQCAAKQELEERLRAELERETSERAALRTRLEICEQTLRERDRELELERQVAAEATRWASRVERTLLDGPSGEADRTGKDDPAAGSGDPSVTTLHGRASRVRIRNAS